MVGKGGAGIAGLGKGGSRRLRRSGSGLVGRGGAQGLCLSSSEYCKLAHVERRGSGMFQDQAWWMTRLVPGGRRGGGGKEGGGLGADCRSGSWRGFQGERGARAWARRVYKLGEAAW